MSDAPHLYGTAKPNDKQGHATREVDTGEKSAAEPGYEHMLRLGGGNVVVVEERSGVAFAEATRDIGEDSLYSNEVEAATARERIGGMVRSDSSRRNMTIAAAVGVGVVLLANLIRKVVVQTFNHRSGMDQSLGR